MQATDQTPGTRTCQRSRTRTYQQQGRTSGHSCGEALRPRPEVQEQKPEQRLLPEIKFDVGDDPGQQEDLKYVLCNSVSD